MLIDSGGQYLDGTTGAVPEFFACASLQDFTIIIPSAVRLDVTRTIHTGTPTAHQVCATMSDLDLKENNNISVVLYRYVGDRSGCSPWC